MNGLLLGCHWLRLPFAAASAVGARIGKHWLPNSRQPVAPFPRPLRRISVSAATAAALLAVAFCAGCGRGRMTGRATPVETLLETGEPPYYVTAQKKEKDAKAEAEEAAKWHRALWVALDKEPAGAEDLREAYRLFRGPAYRELTALLQQLNELVAKNRPPTSEWDVLELKSGFPSPRRGRLAVSLAVGAREVFTPRREVVFEGLPLDQCVMKLARWAGLRDAQSKGFNPRVWWRKDDVTIKTAVEDILRQNGFEAKWSGVEERRVLYPDEFVSREEFLKTAAEIILSLGRSLDTGLPAVIVVPRVKRAEGR